MIAEYSDFWQLNADAYDVLIQRLLAALYNSLWRMNASAYDVLLRRLTTAKTAPK